MGEGESNGQLKTWKKKRKRERENEKKKKTKKERKKKREMRNHSCSSIENNLIYELQERFDLDPPSLGTGDKTPRQDYHISIEERAHRPHSLSTYSLTRVDHMC